MPSSRYSDIVEQSLATGAIALAGATLAIDTKRSVGVRIGCLLRGTASTGSVALEGSQENTVWELIHQYDVNEFSEGTSTFVPISGYPYCRLNVIDDLLDGSDPSPITFYLTGPVNYAGDHALPPGTNTIGKVSQGAAGPDSGPWPVKINPLYSYASTGLDFSGVLSSPADDAITAVTAGGALFQVEISGTYTNAVLNFTLETTTGILVPLLGMRTDTALAESSTGVISNVTRTWNFYVPGIGTSQAGILHITLVSISSGAVVVYGAATAVPHSTVTAASIITLPSYTTALEFDGSSNPIYVGTALQGSAKSAAAWQIRHLTFDGSNNPTDIKFAGGNRDFTSIWDNRASLAYS